MTDDLGDRRCREGCGCRGESLAKDCSEEPWCDICEAWAFSEEADLGSDPEASDGA